MILSDPFCGCDDELEKMHEQMIEERLIRVHRVMQEVESMVSTMMLNSNHPREGLKM